MSRSRPTNKIQSPISLTIEYKGGDGVFQYWDTEKKERINLVYPLSFILLDELSAVHGWSEKFGANIYSNEIHGLNEPIIVKTFKDKKPIEIMTGLYKDIKAKVKELGAKYHKNLIVMITENETIEKGTLCRITLAGAALSAWINKDYDAYHGVIVINQTLDGQKGSVKYKIPVFENDPRAEFVDEEQALDCDKQVQEYYDRLAEKYTAHTEAKEDEPIPTELPSEDNNKGEKKTQAQFESNPEPKDYATENDEPLPF